MYAEPIAIVGRGCVLPGGAHDPETFHRRLMKGAVDIGTAAAAVSGADTHSGHIHGFPTAALSPGADELARIDRSALWALHALRGAMAEAGGTAEGRGRSGLILGHLGFPTRAFADYATQICLGEAPGDPLRRFTTGLVTRLLAEQLGLDGDTVSLDAACATSLYAIKLACDRLRDGSHDMVLAGAVNGADDGVLLAGFRALGALSAGERSRPLDGNSDGLLPGYGATVFALRRLRDAKADGQPVLGVIRAIALSNNGNRGSMLAPVERAQTQLLTTALAQAQLSPKDIGYVECHATGTELGDRIELQALGSVYAKDRALAVGSVKGNIGHLMTAAAGSSLMKVLGAFEHGVLPPVGGLESPLAAAQELGLNVVDRARDWPAEQPFRAGVSAFGLGGPNAHLLVEAYGAEPATTSVAVPSAPAARAPVTITSLGVVTGGAEGCDEFARMLFEEAPAQPATTVDRIRLRREGLRIPPADLDRVLPQQLAILQAAEQALAEMPLPDPDRIGIYVGHTCDGENALAPARHLGRTQQTDRNRIEVTAATIQGLIPNLAANRLNFQLGANGPGFSLYDEESAGLQALETAWRALDDGDIDIALVGAVDLGAEPVHDSAARALLPAHLQPAGDAAVMLVLRRSSDVQGDAWARLEDAPPGSLSSDGELSPLRLALDMSASGATSDSDHITSRIGHAHAASGLLQIATAAVCLAARRTPGGAPWVPPPTGSHAEVSVQGLRDSKQVWYLSVGGAPRALAPPPRHCVERYAAKDRAALVDALSRGATGGEGEFRAAIVAPLEALDSRRRAWIDRFAESHSPAAIDLALPGCHYAEGPIHGKIAHVFTGGASAYPGMGADLLAAFPTLAANAGKTPLVTGGAMSFYGPEAENRAFSCEEQLMGTIWLSQAHSWMVRKHLGLRMDAVLGVSSGETSGLIAAGIWRDEDGMLKRILDAGMYGHYLSGRFDAARQAWGLPEGTMVDWRNWLILAPPERVAEACDGEPYVYVTIINSPQDCVIGGDAAACQQVIERLGRWRAMPLGHDLVVHCPAVEPVAELWRSLHDVPVGEASGIAIYGNAWNTRYTPTRAHCAEGSMRQALTTIDFPTTVRQAWEDGCRVFIEHGPRAALTTAIDRILGTRKHLAVSVDGGPGSDINHLLNSAARLWTYGVPMNENAFTSEPLKAEPELAAAPWESLHELPVHKALPVAHSELLAMPPHHRFIRAGQRAPIHLDHEREIMLTPPNQTAPDTDDGLDASASAKPYPSTCDSPRSHAPPSNPSVEDARAATLVELARLHTAFLQRRQQLHERTLAISEMLRDRMDTATYDDMQHGSGPSQETATAIESVPEDIPCPSSIPSAPDASRQDTKAPSRPAADAQALSSESPGPRAIDRDRLLDHAYGRISDAFGEPYRFLDRYERRVRLPNPPLCLLDQVESIEQTELKMDLGWIISSITPQPDDWYVHQGRMPIGMCIEAGGQPALVLLSRAGVDQQNAGRRMFRLLNFRGVLHAALPAAGERLEFRTQLTGDTTFGSARLITFASEALRDGCPVMEVDWAKAGFFTEEELASSHGVGWHPSDHALSDKARREPTPNASQRRTFDRNQVRALAEGRPSDCFGADFGAPETPAPLHPNPDGRFWHEVKAFEPHGGAFGHGLLRTIGYYDPSDWVFDAHFLNDPCLPGTLMSEGCMQAVGFLMTALGLTHDYPGARFEPVRGQGFECVCRGQVTRDTRCSAYEVHVQEIYHDPLPVVQVSLIAWADDLPIFMCERFGMTMVYDDVQAALAPQLSTPGAMAGLRLIHHRHARHGQAPWRSRHAPQLLPPSNVVQPVTDSGVCGRVSWLPNDTVAAINRPEAIACLAARDHVAAHLNLNPAALALHRGHEQRCLVRSRHFAFNHLDVMVTPEANGWRVTERPADGPYNSRLRREASTLMGEDARTPVNEVLQALARRFVGNIVSHAPDAFIGGRHRPMLILANHQTGVESALVSALAGILTGLPVTAAAKDDHRHSWLGTLAELARSETERPLVELAFFKRADPQAMLTSMQALLQRLHTEGRSLMVHADGTRSLHCRQPPVRQVSGVLLDLAEAADMPILPIRLVGGLPIESPPDDQRLEFPVGLGRQDIHIGRPIEPSELAGLPLAERRERVLSALCDLGPDWRAECPTPPAEAAFAERVDRIQRTAGLQTERAITLAAVLEADTGMPELEEVLHAMADGKSAGIASPHNLSALRDWFTAGCRTAQLNKGSS